ncbi:hypothetical protein FRC01_009205, partial [Tulasnella sp. 417]
MVPSPQSNIAATSIASGSNGLGPYMTPSNAIMIMCTLTDPTDIQVKYFAEPKWTAIQVLADLQYNPNHEMKRYLVMFPCKNTLRDAFVHLRLLKVIVEKTVNRKAGEGAVQSIKTSSVTKDILTESGQPSGPATLEDPSRFDPEGSTSTRRVSSYGPNESAASLLSIDPRDEYHDEEHAEVGEADVHSYWEPAVSTGIQMTLPQNWSTTNVLADREERVESPFIQATVRLATATTDAVERRKRTLELESVLRSLLHAKKDLDEKEAIQRFLDQYQDRPEVPEHWAVDTVTHKYIWTGHNQRYVNKRPVTTFAPSSTRKDLSSARRARPGFAMSILSVREMIRQQECLAAY